MVLVTWTTRLTRKEWHPLQRLKSFRLAPPVFAPLPHLPDQRAAARDPHTAVPSASLEATAEALGADEIFTVLVEIGEVQRRPQSGKADLSVWCGERVHWRHRRRMKKEKG